MTLRDLLKKKDRIDQTESEPQSTPEKLPQASEFKFVRTDTHTEEPISPPVFKGDSRDASPEPEPVPDQTSPSTPKRGLGRFRKQPHNPSTDGSPPSREHKRLSERLHLGGRSRSSSAASSNLPSNLPEVLDAYSERGDEQEKEAQWENRATILARKSPLSTAKTISVPTHGMSQLSLNSSTESRPRSISDVQSDVSIQEAIRLHEDGQLEKATDMFHQLAEQGNVLSQVLYGLALRHGWGCEPDAQRAVTYLSSAASKSAAIESEALNSGMKKGGAAKGELVLAIFELANCFRYGWGVQIDKAAARQYYETAAHLGDTDAMNEAAWCYVEGFGGKKDKFKAAQLLRLAEKNGAKTLGNTWIWKEKYDPK